MPVNVNTRTAAPARGAPGTIDTLFVPAQIDAAGLPIGEAVKVRSLADYIAAGGDRADNPLVYDGLDAFLHESGGGQAYVSRYTTAGDIDDAFAGFTEELGGGHVVAWNEPAGAATSGLLTDYAASTKRYALYDVDETADTQAELEAATITPATNPDYGAGFGPWAIIPPDAAVVGGTPRHVPASAIVAGLCARADALGNPNRAPAGRDFPLQYATGFVGPASMSDQDATTLRNAGINPLRRKFGLLVLDGFRTSIDQSDTTPFWQANPGRARMWLQWQALIAGLNYEYKPIDARGRIAGRLKTDLDAICLQLFAVDGLYGTSPKEAFSNSVQIDMLSAAEGVMNATCEAVLGMHGETVNIDLVSVPVTGRVSG